MPFDEVETETKDNMPPTALLSYMRPSRKGGQEARNKGKPRLSITCPTTICGTSKSERHVLLVGTGADKGKLRVRAHDPKRDKGKGVKPTEFKKHFIWRFGYVPKLGDEIFDGERHPVTRISAEEFEIIVPESLLAGLT